MKRYIFLCKVRLQDMEDFHSNHFRRSHLVFHKVNIEVNVLMIHFIDNLRVNDFFHQLKVDQEPGFWVYLALNGNKQIIVMAMPIRVCTDPENSFIFFRSPIFSMQFMGSVKSFASCYINHSTKIALFNVI